MLWTRQIFPIPFLMLPVIGPFVKQSINMDYTTIALTLLYQFFVVNQADQILLECLVPIFFGP